MATTICFFNINNLFLRYHFGKKYPGDISGKSYVADPRWGYLPQYTRGSFKLFRPEQTTLSASALSADGLPDVLFLCEVESLLALRSFNEEYLGSHYEYALLVDSRDFRQIDVGVLSTKEILQVRTHVDDQDKEGKWLFSRDCLEVVLALNKSGSKRLPVFVNHLKSKFVDTRNKTKKKIEAETKKSNERRQRQAGEIKKIVRKNFPGNSFNEERFVVVGDLNDQPDSPWVRPIVKQAGLYNVIEALPEDERWTYWWRSKNRVSLIDYLLLSPALAESVTSHNIKPRIERRGIGIKGLSANGRIKPRTTRIFKMDDDPSPERVGFEFQRFPSIQDSNDQASDHCPVFLEIP